VWRRAELEIIRTLSFNGAPVIDKDGNFIYAVVTVRDISEQKSIEEDRERLLEEVNRQRRLAGDDVRNRSRWGCGLYR